MSSIAESQLSFSMRQIAQKVAFINKIALMVCINSLPLFPSLFEISFIGILLSDKIPFTVEFVLMKSTDIVLVRIPLVYAAALLHPVYKLSFKEGY